MSPAETLVGSHTGALRGFYSPFPRWLLDSQRLLDGKGGTEHWDHCLGRIMESTFCPENNESCGGASATIRFIVLTRAGDVAPGSPLSV
ncbi:unnamed protein product [Gadus morhua 'NCC']